MNPRLRLMLLGRPKAGKTTLLAQVMDAGFRVGLLDFDNNSDPLRVYASEKGLQNLSVIPLRDDFRFNSDTGALQLEGEPKAFTRACRALDDWSKADPEHPWGPVKDWSQNYVLALDSLTGLGDAAFNRILANNGKSEGSVADRDWGMAMRQEDMFLAWVMGNRFHCHVVVTAHLKLIEPKIERSDRKDSDDLVTAKEAISLARAEQMPTRYYPTALGRALPQEITRRVPAAALVEAHEGGKRVIYTQPPKGMEIDVGVPGRDLRPEIPHDGGLLRIMKAVTGTDRPAAQ